MDYVQKLGELDPVYKTLIGLAAFVTLVFGIFSWPFFLFVATPILFKIYLKLTCGKTPSTRRMDGKVIIVTGGNGGLGYETVKDLGRRGGKVIMACRNVDKGNKAKEQIKKEIPQAEIIVMKLDVSSLKSVREFAAKFQSEFSRLDVLVNNAGSVTREKKLTGDNLETNFATNHFGPFLLTNLLLGLMKKTGGARIVMVSGEGYKMIKSVDLENLNAEKSFNFLTAAVTTKLANILFLRELERRFRANGITEITINALHPGLVSTDVFDSFETTWYLTILTRLLKLFAKTAWEGAQTQIHLSVAEEVEELSGKYWIDCHEAGISKLAQDPNLAKAMWEKSVQAVRLKPEESIFEKL